MKKLLLFIILITLLITGCSSNTNKEKEDNSLSQEKETYYNNVSMYVKDVMVKITDGIEYKYNSSDTMLFIPAGNWITCVSDNVFASPFSKSWKYIYVGVYYDGEEYHYSVASKDGENYEIELMTQKDLYVYNYKKIKKNKTNSIKEFIDNYKEGMDGNKTYSINKVSKPLKEFVKSNYKKVKNIVFIDTYECSYE